MTMHYARIAGDIVAELIPAGHTPLAERFHADVVAACLAVPADLPVQVGWTYHDGAFAPPEAAPAAPRIRAIRTWAFRRRLPVATRQTITLAAAAAMRATPPDATLQTWLDDLSSTNTALLDDAELQAGVAALLGAGLITHAERDALLADGTAEEV